MSPLEAILLGLVQGLTEFLPVSSSGHLVMVQTLMGLTRDGLLFEVTVHVATLASVLIFYRRRIAELVVGVLRGQRDAWRYGGKLVVATLPVIAAVLGGGDLLEAQFDAPQVAGVCLLITGAVLFSTRFTAAKARATEPSWTAAVLIGCAQAFAILPGISRSGTTVAMALALGVSPLAAAEFSFLMGVAAISGAAIRTVPALSMTLPGEVAGLAIGGAVALVSGVAAISIFVRLLRTQSFHLFAYYAWAAGAAFLLWLAV